MRRYVFVILFFVVLITPFLLRAMYGKTDSKPASSGDALPLIVVTPHDEGIRREFAQAFSRWHQQKYGRPVAVDYRNFGGTSAIVQFFNASKELYKQIGTYHVDIAWGGGDFLFDSQLKKDGHLAPAELSPDLLKAVYPQPTLAGLALYDPAKDPQWFGVCLGAFGIAYNKDVLRYLQLDAPKTWSDLTDPKYRNWIVMADPALSASARTSYMIVIERAMADAEAAMADKAGADDIGWQRGMGQLRLIASNARLFVDSGAAQPGVVATGDAAASMVIDFFARATIANVGADRMGYVEPVNATAINPDPVALVKGAEHKETAQHFIEFLLSPEAQKLWIYRAGSPGGPVSTEVHRMPIRREVYEDQTNFTDKGNPFKNAETFNTSNARKQTFGILGELMTASMIDTLDDLRNTRKVILASPKAAELEAKLAVFPFGQTEALARAKRYNAAPASDRLGIVREWTNEFRAEYKLLREQAAP